VAGGRGTAKDVTAKSAENARGLEGREPRGAQRTQRVLGRRGNRRGREEFRGIGSCFFLCELGGLCGD